MPRLERQRHHDLGGALIAVGQFADRPFGLVGEAAHAEQFVNALADFDVVGLRQPGAQTESGGDLDRDAQIFPHRQFGKDLGDLEGPRHAAPDAARRQQMRDVLAVENDAARCRREEAGDQIEEGRLAGAVRADDGAQLAGLDRHRDIVDGDQAAEMLRDVFDLEQTHDAAFRRMMPSTPRGKNKTTSTKNRPINDIQFSVSLEM